MSEYQYLTSEWVAKLIAQPISTFVTLDSRGNRITTVGMLTLDENDFIIPLDAQAQIAIRPDKLPEEALQLTMLSLNPLYVGNVNVGWLATFPALKVTCGRNFVQVKRGNSRVTERDKPQLSVFLRSIVIMEVEDTMTLLLSTRLTDMRT